VTAANVPDILQLEPLVAAIGSADSRARKTSLRLEDFDKKTFVMYSTDGARYFHDLVAVLLNRAQVNPINVQYMTQIHSILALVSSGLGAAIVPAAARTLHFEGVTFRVIKTTPSRPVELYLAWRKDSDNAVLGQFLELVQTAAAKAVLGTTGSDRLQDTNGT